MPLIVHGTGITFPVETRWDLAGPQLGDLPGQTLGAVRVTQNLTSGNPYSGCDLADREHRAQPEERPRWIIGWLSSSPFVVFSHVR